MLGAALKIDGKFILQTRSEGPVSFLVAHYYAPGNIRGYASFDQAAFEAVPDAQLAEGAKLLGDGHLAMTIDQGPDMERYQGIVPLEGGNISEAADLYFRQSEQLPTFIKIAIARQYEAGKDDNPGSWSWRAGGLMVQKLTEEGGGARHTNGHDAEDAWTRAQIARLDRRGSRIARPDAGAGAPALPPVPRGAGARLQRHADFGLLPMLAREGGADADELHRRGHRGHGRRRPRPRHLRILQQRIRLRRQPNSARRPRRCSSGAAGDH